MGKANQHIKAIESFLKIDFDEKVDLIHLDSILCGWRGSIAHGTHINHDDPDTIDDFDIISVVIPDIEYYLGLKEWGSRGTKEIVKFYTVDDKTIIMDCVQYELKKFLSMVANGNANALPLLFMDDIYYLLKDGDGRILLDNRHLFLTKKIWKSFKGYAESQIHKMHKGEIAGHFGAKRREMFKNFGYDVKSASHLIRLLRTSLELLETGNLNVYRHDAQELLDIKTGKWSEEKVMRESDLLLEHCEIAFQKTNLPDNPDYNTISELSSMLIYNKIGKWKHYYNLDEWNKHYRRK